MTVRVSGLAPTRQFWVVAHRWAGLTITLFLVIVGFTGALLPWNAELTRLARPSLSAATPPYAGAKVLDGITLAKRVERATGAKVRSIQFDVAPDHIASLSVGPRDEKTRLGYDTVWADPYTGAIRLKYRDGVLADGPQSIMSFLYSLHMELALGRVGRLALGIAALVWTIDCFVGFYLTFPVRRRPLPGPPPATAPGWWRRWKPAWLVRWQGGRHKLTFDLHRAGGLWVWPLLLVFAWSSVGFNLDEVHGPVMRLFGATEWVDLPMTPEPLADPPIGVRAAKARGDQLLREIGARRGFTVVAPAWMSYYADNAVYRYNARSSLDVLSEGGRTTVYFSAVDGRLLKFDPPVSANPANAFSTWLGMLHLAQVFGLPYRVFVSATGLLVVTLSVTGVLIWMRKRSARLLGRSKRVRFRKAPSSLLEAAE